MSSVRKKISSKIKKLTHHRERSKILNNLNQVIQEKGFEYLIDNHINDIKKIEVTDAEWFNLARADERLSPKVEKLKFDSDGKAILEPTAAEKLKQQNEQQNANNEWGSHHFPHLPHLPHLHHLHKSVLHKVKPVPHPQILERDGSGVLYLSNTMFQNWDKTIAKRNSYIFYPRSKAGIQNIIRWAKQYAPNLSIRASGYAHSSSEIFGDDDQIQISMLDYKTANHLPAKHPKIDPYNDLQGIQLVGAIEENGETKALCKIGTATCNYNFRNWVHDPYGGNLQWGLPANVVMTEITFGGDIIPICHGAGPSTKTLSDYVVEMEYIDVNGNIQTIRDPELIKAAAGSFGLEGIVTSVTLKLDRLTYANLSTMEKRPWLWTIPPATYEEVPADMKPYFSREMYNQAQREFEDHIRNDYYTEWFYFPVDVDDPNAKNCWINCWKNNGNPARAERFPPTPKLLEAGTYIGDIANMTFFKSHILSGKQQAHLLGKVTMATLPDHPDVVCTLEDAEHFRNDGIQNIREHMVEFEVGIPPRQDDPTRPDLAAIQRMWHDVINEVRATQNEFPLRTTLEMRIMGGSDVLMAPQYGNKWTAAIEILTPPQVNPDVWNRFVQTIVDKWTQHKNSDGLPVKILPHWAKGFDNLSMYGMPAWDYLKQAYSNRIPAFNERMAKIAEQGNYSFEEMQKRFSNAKLRKFFWEPNNSYSNNQYSPYSNGPYDPYANNAYDPYSNGPYNSYSSNPYVSYPRNPYNSYPSNLYNQTWSKTTENTNQQSSEQQMLDDKEPEKTLSPVSYKP